MSAKLFQLVVTARIRDVWLVVGMFVCCYTRLKGICFFFLVLDFFMKGWACGWCYRYNSVCMNAGVCYNLKTQCQQVHWLCFNKYRDIFLLWHIIWTHYPELEMKTISILRWKKNKIRKICQQLIFHCSTCVEVCVCVFFLISMKFEK